LSGRPLRGSSERRGREEAISEPHLPSAEAEQAGLMHSQNYSLLSMWIGQPKIVKISNLEEVILL
jgi:hypothetical protein